MAKTALVTGGARRIGRAISLGLADSGFDIALHYHHSLSEAESVAGAIVSAGRKCTLYRADFSRMTEVNRLISDVLENHSDCELLVNNVSLFQKAGFLETDEALYDRHFMVNVKVPFFLTQSFALGREKGHVVNILDTKISKEMTGYFVYSMTKKTLHEFTRLSAKALGPDIRVNGVAPGMILSSADTTESELERMAAGIPLGRKGEVGDVVSAVRFLVGQPYITGQTIYVDGGEHLN